MQESKGSRKDSSNYNFRGGHILSHPAPGDEVIISGVSGAFPNSKNVHEFRDNLFNKSRMLLPSPRWVFDHPEMANYSGCVPDINKFDSGFFGVHERQSHSLDPMARLLHEKAIEAILDAGLNPIDLENSKTGVFIAVSGNENSKLWFLDNLQSHSYAMTGSERSMIAHRLSYFLKLKGPSYTIDTACSGSSFTLEHAYRAIRLGEIENAIVCGTQLCLHPLSTLQNVRLGVLSLGSCCKCFDAEADGYMKSEAIVCIILQKSKFAKRSYAQVIHVKSNCDGYKVENITFPSAYSQMDMLTSCYEECGIDRYSLSYLEAHETGTLIGGNQECLAIDEVLTKDRKRPLLVGSLKSNAGHAEGAAGLCSIIKCVIAMETGYIPPNISFNSPRKNLKGIVEGRMKVVVDKTPLEDDHALMGINCIGFGGTNSHVVLRRNRNRKIEEGLPKDDIPRLVCVSGRTEEAVTTLLDEICSQPIDVEHIGLLHEGFRKNIVNHLYRGYTIVTKSGEMKRSVKYFAGDLPPLYLSFGQLNNWDEIGRQLMILPAFSESIYRVQEKLSGRGILPEGLFKDEDAKGHFDPILGNIVVQVAMIDVLKLLEIKPKDNFGSSFGGLFSSYYNGLLSLDEVINFHFEASKTIVEQGSNAIINLCNGDGDGASIGNNRNRAGAVEDNSTPFEIPHLAVLKENPKWNIVNDIKSEKSTKFDLNSVVILIGKTTFEDLNTITLFGTKNKNHLEEFLDCLGRLYELGYDPQVSRLYPSVTFPVRRGTRMISPYIKWNHSRDKSVFRFESNKNGVNNYRINMIDQNWKFLTEHVADGINLFPAAGYLYIVWDTFSLLKGMALDTMQVTFENCKFIRATTISEVNDLVFQVAIHSASGYFEVIESNSIVVTGRISISENEQEEFCADHSKLFPIRGSKGSFVPLKEKDIYKELRLRGYESKGAFRGIAECNPDVTGGYLKWEKNWITFISSILDLNILKMDTRMLYILTHISKITIHAKPHLDIIERNLKTLEKKSLLPAFIDTITGVTRCGGVSIKGVMLDAISRKKDMSVPVLQKCVFVPNITELNIHESVRVNVQIILENTLIPTYKVVEVIDEFTPKGNVSLAPMIKLASADQPLVQQDFKILSKYPVRVDVPVANGALEAENDCLLVIASNASRRKEILNGSVAALKANGFVISREPLNYDASQFHHPEFTILTVHKTPEETLILLQRQRTTKTRNYIRISSDDFAFLPFVKEALHKKNEDQIVYTEEPKSGILGFLHSLRKEPDGNHIRCVCLMDGDKEFQPTHPFFDDQLKKNMVINIFKKGKWGTYRYLQLNQGHTVEKEHSMVSTAMRGDISSIRWVEGPLRHKHYHMVATSTNTLIHVHYAAINVRDVMIASGESNIVALNQDRLEEEYVMGVECAGINDGGQRIMSVVCSGALSSLVFADPYLTFKLPDSWTMEEAATAPFVYCTLLYALVINDQIKREDSILIHSGAGDIGQAAIHLCLYYQCTIFATVDSETELNFLYNNFPQLKDHYVVSSQNESLEQMVRQRTNGRGVDVVLCNSRSKEAVTASLRCLAQGGRFIEFGTNEISVNNQINLFLLQKEASFCNVAMNQVINESPLVKSEIADLFKKMLQDGAIRPLSRNVFSYDEIGKAFKFFSNNRLGKVLVQIRKPEEQFNVLPAIRKFPVAVRYLCDPEKTYVIVGGLGGFGLEVANWLVNRGARKLVLSSRTGVNNGYQEMRIRIWRSRETLVKISTAPVTTKAGCKQLIEESLQLGRIDAIFNLAAVLKDSFFENQTVESFSTAFAPKATATAHLDDLTREMCPDLRKFVVFSSISCGRGNPGQTNYCMANSAMERICEKRKADGYPALAIEWGSIGEVGLVAETMEADVVGDTLRQSISSCFQVVDLFLRQEDEVIVSSIVVPEKEGIDTTHNIADSVVKILGQKNVESVNPHTTLSELGMDSMTVAEIKKHLEDELGVHLPTKEIGRITLSRLNEIQKEKQVLSQEIQPKHKQFGIETVFRPLSDGFDSNTFHTTLKPWTDQDSAIVLLFMGMDAFGGAYKTLASKIRAYTVPVLFPRADQPSTILELAESLIPTVGEYMSQNKPFIIVSYSYGTLIALEVVYVLESKGYVGTIISLDGAPLLTQRMLSNFGENLPNFQSNLICHLLSFYVPNEIVSNVKEAMLACDTWEEKLNLGLETVKDNLSNDKNHLKEVLNGNFWLLKALSTYRSSYGALKSNIKLYKPREVVVRDLEVDYGLSRICGKPVDTKMFQGDHITFLKDENLLDAINADISSIVS